MVRLQLYLGDLDTVHQERGHCDQEEDGSLHVTMSSAARAPLHTGDNSHSFHVPGTHTASHSISLLRYNTSGAAATLWWQCPVQGIGETGGAG